MISVHIKCTYIWGWIHAISCTRYIIVVAYSVRRKKRTSNIAASISKEQSIRNNCTSSLVKCANFSFKKELRLSLWNMTLTSTQYKNYIRVQIIWEEKSKGKPWVIYKNMYTYTTSIKNSTPQYQAYTPIVILNKNVGISDVRFFNANRNVQLNMLVWSVVARKSITEQ